MNTKPRHPTPTMNTRRHPLRNAGDVQHPLVFIGELGWRGFVFFVDRNV